MIDCSASTDQLTFTVHSLQEKHFVAIEKPTGREIKRHMTCNTFLPSPLGPVYMYIHVKCALYNDIYIYIYKAHFTCVYIYIYIYTHVKCALYIYIYISLYKAHFTCIYMYTGPKGEGRKVLHVICLLISLPVGFSMATKCFSWRE